MSAEDMTTTTSEVGIEEIQATSGMTLTRRNANAENESDEDVLRTYSIALRTLGTGMSGDVVVVTSRATGEEFALKTIDKTNLSETSIAFVRREIDILTKLNHPHIIRPLDVFENRTRIAIVMELGRGGDLFDWLAKQPEGRFQPHVACDLVRSMLLALAHCHAHGIVHRDVKLDNFVFDRVGKGRVLKLIDFGLSKQWVPPKERDAPAIKKMKTCCGTVDTSAPEVQNMRVPYDSKCDMFSLGCVTYALLCGVYPFAGETKAEILRKKSKGRYNRTRGYLWESPDCREARHFVQRLLRSNPKERPSAAEALNLPFMQHYLPVKKEVLATTLDAVRQFATNMRPIQRLALTIRAHFSKDPNTDIAHDVFLEIDKDRSGRISRSELSDALQKHGRSELSRAAFDALDVDGTGKINFSEFLAACFFLNGDKDRNGRAADSSPSSLTDVEIDEIFDRLDCDDSGTISLANIGTTLGIVRAEMSSRDGESAAKYIRAFLSEPTSEDSDEDEGKSTTTALPLEIPRNVFFQIMKSI